MRMAQPIAALVLSLVAVTSIHAQQPITTFGNMPRTINTGTYNPIQTMRTPDLTNRFRTQTATTNFASKVSLTNWMPTFNLTNIFREKTAPTGVTVLSGSNNPFQPVRPIGYDMLNPPAKTK